MLTALTIHLIHVENIFVAFLRVLQRAFWPKQLLLVMVPCLFRWWGVVQALPLLLGRGMGWANRIQVAGPPARIARVMWVMYRLTGCLRWCC